MCQTAEEVEKRRYKPATEKIAGFLNQLRREFQGDGTDKPSDKQLQEYVSEIEKRVKNREVFKKLRIGQSVDEKQITDAITKNTNGEDLLLGAQQDVLVKPNAVAMIFGWEPRSQT